MHRRPVYCVVSYAREAEATVCWLRTEVRKFLLASGCVEGLVKDAVKRVRLITADMKTSRGAAGTFAKEVFLDPEVRAREADVLVCTYAAEAGVSMPAGHFQSVFGLLYTGVGTWDSQFQSLNRVRMCSRWPAFLPGNLVPWVL